MQAGHIFILAVTIRAGYSLLNVTMTGEAAGDSFWLVQYPHAGDVNGDGYSDVIVGARLNDAGGTDFRQVIYIFWRCNQSIQHCRCYNDRSNIRD